MSKATLKFKKCHRCGDEIGWDDTPNPICSDCAVERIAELEAEVAVLSGTACAEEQAEGNGPCGACRTCRNKRVAELEAENARLRDGAFSKIVASEVEEVRRNEVDPLRAENARLRKAMADIYFSAHWRADRTVDEVALWTAARNAFGFTPGESTRILGPFAQNSCRDGYKVGHD